MNYIKRIVLFALVLFSTESYAQAAGTPYIVPQTISNGVLLNTIQFNFTGAIQSWVVPSGVTFIEFDIRGAQGGSTQGGRGGRVEGRINVTPGTTLFIYVGGQPSGRLAVYGFAGNGGSSMFSGFGGGGLSAISTSNVIGTSGLIAVAAGGGGASGNSTNYTVDFFQGGFGGGTSGGNGSFGNFSGLNEGGRGGTQTAGGARGQFFDPQTSNPTAGSAFAGGNGGSVDSSRTTWVSGGGGGAGFFGGGGGAGGGHSNGAGGGGSSFISASAINTVNTQNSNTGNGFVVIRF